MKKLAFVFAALVFGAGVAVAKDAKVSKEASGVMSDSEMDKVVAGEPNYHAYNNGQGADNTPSSNPQGNAWAVGQNKY